MRSVMIVPVFVVKAQSIHNQINKTSDILRTFWM